MGSSWQTAVASSCSFIWNPPSPETLTTGISGRPSAAPMAAGRPYPIVPRPPEVSSLLLPRSCKNCVVHIWFCPTSVVTMASGNCALIPSMMSCGVKSPSRGIAMGFSARSACKRSAQPSACLGGTAISENFSIASFASATMGTSTTILREMDAASISMCTIRALGANWDNFPVTRSSKRAPTARMTSA